jgi:hypothetical protein
MVRFVPETEIVPPYTGLPRGRRHDLDMNLQ